MDRAEATRQICWNISQVWLMYVLFAPTVVVGGYGLWRRFRLWRAGQPVVRFDRPLERVGLLAQHGLLQLRTLRKAYPGTFHLLVYAAFIVLTIATTVVMLDWDFGLPIMQGPFYLWFQSLIVDLLGGLLLVGVGLAVIRRWAQRPRQLVYTREASWLLVLIGVIAVTGFLLEGWRIAVTSDPWAAWSPIGAFTASIFDGVNPGTLRALHLGVWWFHLALVFGFLAWAPYTKLAHVLTAPLAIFTANLDGYQRGLKPLDFEGEAPLGVASLERFHWRDLLDLDACTECGRCTAVCPANVVGKALSPRDIVLDLRRLAHSRGTDLLAARGREARADEEPAIPVIREGTALRPETLWECTTCAACLEACPVFIEQLPKILDTRRFLVMEEADYPQTMADAVTSLEQRGHPFPGAQFSRVDWAEGLDIPILGDLEDPGSVDILLWVGCANALLERNHAIVRAVATLLSDAGVSFATLGREERCTGDPARRIGNEFLFQQLATKNIQLLERYGVRRILTCCPHCYHTFANDYPALGGVYEVHHHASYLARLVTLGRLRPQATGEGPVTYHDPCYLGRYNGIFGAPRDVVRRATGGAVVEMAAHHGNGFCCGGGGGMSFAEEPPNQRVNRERARQAAATGAEVVAVACPFCMTMLSDGVGALASDGGIAVRDVAELLRSAVPATGTTH